MRLRAPLLALLLALQVPLSGCAWLAMPAHHGVVAMRHDDLLVGAWPGQWPTDRRPLVDSFQEKAGIHLDVVDVRLDWATPYGNVSHTVAHIQARGAVVMLTWEPNGFSTRDVAEGTAAIAMRDGRVLSLRQALSEFAGAACAAARAADHPFLLRVLHEPNGDWFPWALGHRDAWGDLPNSPDTYRAAWKVVHDAFAARCGSLVRFVWSVNHLDVGLGSTMLGAYPGDAYVDVVGIDGYNWGSHREWGWQGFDAIFRDAYCTLRGLGKPMLLTEVASAEKGGDKARWIEDMYAAFDDYAGVRGFVWSAGPEGEARAEWEPDSSAAALAAFSAGAQHQARQRMMGLHGPAAGPGVAC